MAMEEKDIKVSEEAERVKQAASKTIFYRELSSGKCVLYAKRYAKMIVYDGMSESQARKEMERYLSELKGRKRKRICEDTRIKLAAAGVTRDEIRYIVKVDEELSGSKQYFPGFCESALPTLYHACTDFMPRDLSVDKSLPKLNKNDLIEGSRDRCAHVFREMIENGLNASAIDEEIKSDKANIYILQYATLRFIKGMSEDEARKQAETFENKIRQDNIYTYFLLESINRGLEYDKAVEQADIAERKFKEGHSKKASLYYAELITRGQADYKSKEQLFEFERTVKKKSDIYAHYCTDSFVFGEYNE